MCPIGPIADAAWNNKLAECAKGVGGEGLTSGFICAFPSSILIKFPNRFDFLSLIFGCIWYLALVYRICAVLRCCVVHKSIGERTGKRTCVCFGYQYINNMSSSDQKTDISALPSDQVVPATIKEGLERGTWYVGAGLAAGALASIVLARGGGASRKVITAFGGGVGMGAAWTRCSMDLEDVLEK